MYYIIFLIIDIKKMSKSFSSNKNISLKDKFEKSDEQIFTPTLNDIQAPNDDDHKNKEEEIEEKKSKIGKNKHYLYF